ncbi:hypothetical protein [Dyadobacter sp. CY343]|uniref:hypothetical protein n=1 Tax=Dyadobacter sp. CY343 TaxID=2907299 RepID=UPI001F37274D|nr:hypothetical protein [Dyadobacter sp. CY343]MCE7062611.1 hypothetical protein [Dyadobacter sp. CY343]
MNFIIILLVTALLQIFSPWWVIAIVPFAIHLWRPTAAFNSFWISFLAVGALWLGYGYYLHLVSNGAISDRIAQIFFLPNGLLLLLLSALIGGLVAGFAGLSGFLVRDIFSREPGS